MRLERLQCKGFSSAFPGIVDLSLRDLPPGLVAIVGRNGTGKTTLLEATPGALYRQLPARNGVDPVDYATGRDSWLDLEFSIDGRGAFRARLNLDGVKRQTDAVLEAVLADGTRTPLNDGKRSTYDEAIRSRFPSFDLFINSSFAAQGRGDEFTRRKPSQRKDLFVEFLALQHLATMAKTAADAAQLAGEARLRLEAQVDVLERDTAAPHLAALDTQAHDLQTRGGRAEVRQHELKATILDLEGRLAMLADQVAAHAAATRRLESLERELATRQGERQRIDLDRDATAWTLTREQERVTAKRTADVAAIDEKIANNQQLQGRATEIRAAVLAISTADDQLARSRAEITAQQATVRQAEFDRRQVEQQLAALGQTEHRLVRARTDASILGSVPCGGVGEYAACQFLLDATAAQATIAALEQELRPKADLADRVAALTRTIDVATTAVQALQREVSGLEQQRARLHPTAQFLPKLEAADARIAELTAARARAMTDADEQLRDAQGRHDARVQELTTNATELDDRIRQVQAEVHSASVDMAATEDGTSQATGLQADLALARREWDQVTATLATVQSGRDELDRRRQDLAAKRTALDDVRRRKALVDQELVEWQDLAKALGKGGLPDLEIDAAGPTISALTNELLLSCFGPRFSLELVTQVAKADGSGLKDEFTVKVTDNESGAEPRDIAFLSGGEKTIVQEALMSAIALYVNQRSPMPIRTLWRDETGAALDADNAVRYVEMLRKVQQLGGFHHVYFISHNRESAALADVQIQVGEGRAVIVQPPFVEAA